MNKAIPVTIYAASLCFFVLGLSHPIMATKTFFGMNREEVYLAGSIRYFYDNGDWFVGSILLFFTLIFPVIKYLFLASRLLNIPITRKKGIMISLELINKWAMLDVFVVALIIINLKFDSLIIVTSLRSGTTFFAASVLLLMICSYMIKNLELSNGRNKSAAPDLN